MKAALDLARRGLGNVAPNPAVGCILVREDLGNRIVGRGWTQPGGRPHAETEAIRRAGDLTGGATAYVTLEPCNHVGQTGPCAQALIDAGIRRVVGALQDPDPRTSGGGFQRLRDAGIDVETGLLESESRDLNAGFISAVTAGRPHVAWKSAASGDGRIATQTGESRWITGPVARNHGHLLRATHDAIIVGAETASRDDPSLTCRLPGLGERSPARIVLSTNGNLDPEGQLARTARDIPVVVHALWIETELRSKLEKSGVEVVVSASDPLGRVDVESVLRDLAKQGMTRVLIEGGGTLAASFLKKDLIDRIYSFRAPMYIGSEGRPMLGNCSFGELSAIPTFTRRENCVMGADILEVMDRRREI